MWFNTLVVALCCVLSISAAPFPAHLVTNHRPSRPVFWQEFPVALTQTPVTGGQYKPIPPGSDHGLYNQGFFEGDIQRSDSEEHNMELPATKNSVTDPKLLWPYGTVIFKVADDVGCPESPQCEILMSAMDHYHQHSCIRFKEWSGEKDFVTIFFNTGSSSACWSAVGRIGDGEQRLSLGQRCWYKGIVIHELGHAIGFWHEMNRPDRDSWIYVYWQNIIPGFASAFRKHDQRSVATLGEQFDYKSIMMYDEYAFSKDGKSPTLQAVTGQEIGPIWRKPGLSASDKRRLQKLYKCDPTKPKPGYPYDVSCDFNRHTCGFKNGISAVWNWRTVNRTDGYVYSSYDTAGTTPGHFMSINFPELSEERQKVNGALGCVRFYYLLRGSGKTHLKLEQAYLRKVTQLNHDEAATFDLWQNDTATNSWIHVEVPLYVTRSFRLIFTSQFNKQSTDGIIALDDVELLYRPCNPTMSTTSSSTSSHAHSPSSVKPTPTTPGVTVQPSTSTSTTPSSSTFDPAHVSALEMQQLEHQKEQLLQLQQQQQEQIKQQLLQQQQHSSTVTASPHFARHSTNFPTFHTTLNPTESFNNDNMNPTTISDSDSGTTFNYDADEYTMDH